MTIKIACTQRQRMLREQNLFATAAFGAVAEPLGEHAIDRIAMRTDNL